MCQPMETTAADLQCQVETKSLESVAAVSTKAGGAGKHKKLEDC